MKTATREKMRRFKAKKSELESGGRFKVHPSVNGPYIFDTKDDRYVGKFEA